MDMISVQSGLAALQAMIGLSKAVIDVRDEQKMRALQSELNQRILDAQQAMFAMRMELSASADRLDEVKAELAELKARARERERYVLHELRPGAFVYALREGVQPAEPAHYLCQPCYDKGTKSVLEAMDLYVHGPSYLCASCERHIAIDAKYRPPPFPFGPNAAPL